MTTLTPLSSLQVTRHLIPAHSSFPNSPARPLLIYHNVFPSPSAPSIESHLRKTGVVEPQWRYPMYRQHHYHSTTHEVLAIASGSARVCFGGSQNPHRVETEVKKGDVIVVPAGVAHGLLDSQGVFEMVGSYPVGGEQWDHCTGNEELAEVKKRIDKLRWFERDPVYGDQGPVLDVQER